MCEALWVVGTSVAVMVGHTSNVNYAAPCWYSPWTPCSITIFIDILRVTSLHMWMLNKLLSRLCGCSNSFVYCPPAAACVKPVNPSLLGQTLSPLPLLCNAIAEAEDRVGLDYVNQIRIQTPWI